MFNKCEPSLWVFLFRPISAEWSTNIIPWNSSGNIQKCINCAEIHVLFAYPNNSKSSKNRVSHNYFLSSLVDNHHSDFQIVTRNLFYKYLSGIVDVRLDCNVSKWLVNTILSNSWHHFIINYHRPPHSWIGIFFPTFSQLSIAIAMDPRHAGGFLEPLAAETNTLAARNMSMWFVDVIFAFWGRQVGRGKGCCLLLYKRIGLTTSNWNDCLLNYLPYTQHCIY